MSEFHVSLYYWSTKPLMCLYYMFSGGVGMISGCLRIMYGVCIFFLLCFLRLHLSVMWMVLLQDLHVFCFFVLHTSRMIGLLVLHVFFWPKKKGENREYIYMNYNKSYIFVEWAKLDLVDSLSQPKSWRNGDKEK